MNGFPTTNRRVRSSAIYRTFQHYRINKLIFINRTPGPVGFLLGGFFTVCNRTGLPQEIIELIN